MAEIDRYRSEDRRSLETLYRRVFGSDAAEANRLRWNWQYGRNPHSSSAEPLIWVAREGHTVVGQCATMPVSVSVNGRAVDAAWGMDVMVAPERQRQGLGEALFRTWDRHVGAALGLGLSESSSRLFHKLHWPTLGVVPRLTKPISRRAFRRATWPLAINGLVSAIMLPWVRRIARALPLEGEVRRIGHFDAGFTRLWERVGQKFAFAVRRDAPYLNWKYIQPPHVRYSAAALMRDGEPQGYVVYRHAQEPLGRVTLLVDFLADPADAAGFLTLLRWLDREARAADSDKIRTFATHEGFRRLLRQSGYQPRRSAMELVAKVNAVAVPSGYYASTDEWHVTLGDSDQDH